MKHSLPVIALIAVASTAPAQVVYSPGIPQSATTGPLTEKNPNFGGLTPYLPLDDGLTPSTLAYRLKRVKMLRSEALALQAADGGTLTPDHRAYVNRKLNRIMPTPAFRFQ